MTIPKVFSINGPIIKIRGENFAMAEMISVNGIPGEVISLKPHEATAQIYENPSGLKPGMPVQKMEQPMSLTLRPGIIGGIFDGADVIIGLY